MTKVSSSNGLEHRPKLRFHSFNIDWQKSRLENYSEYQSSSLTIKDALDKGVYVLYDVNNIIGFSNFGYNQEYISIIKDGSGIGRTRYMYAKTNCIGTMGIILSRNISTKFLYYLINTINLSKYYVGSSIPHIYYKDFKKENIYLPINKEEQNKIANFLTLIDQKIEKQQELVDLLKKYKRGLVFSLFNQGINKEKMRIGDFCEVQMCKRIFKNQTSSFGEIPFYKIGTIGSQPDAFISKELFEEYKAKYNYPKKGEFLISCSGTVGKCVRFDGEDSYFQDSNIVWLRNNSNIVDNEYLFYLISNVDWSILNSTTITRIYSDNLRELEFCFPPVEEQRKIAHYLLFFDKKINQNNTYLEELKKQKKGLLQQLFI